MELAGKVIAVLEPRGGVSKTGNEWKVQEYVIETHDQYPKKMCFDVFGADKIAQFNIQAGEEVRRYENGRDRIGQVILTGKSLQECEERLEEVLANIHIEFTE